MGSNLLPHPVTAQGLVREGHLSRVIKVPAHHHRISGKKQRSSRHTAKHVKQQRHVKKQKKQTVAGSPTVTVTVAGSPTATVIASSTVTAIATPLVPAPDLYLHLLRLSESHLKAGKKLTYVLIAGNSAGAARISKKNSIVIMEVVPLGLTHLKAQGRHWKISLSDTVSPAVLTATYDGTYPVKADTTLAPIFFSGMLNADAEPSITTTASIDAPGNTNALDSTATDTAFIGSMLPVTFAPVADTTTPTPGSATPTVTATLAATATTSVTATSMPSPTPSVTMTPVPSPTHAVTVTPKPSPTFPVTMTPTPDLIIHLTATPTVSAIPPVSPKFRISISRPGAAAGDTYTVGQNVNYVLQASNIQGAENQIVTVLDIASVGISNITVRGAGWTIGVSNTVGPAALTATFNGPYPIAAGTNLPPITISGTLTGAAGPLFSNAVGITSSDDPDSSSNISIDSIAVRTATLATVTIPTVIETATPTVIETATPTAVMTALSSATPAVTPTLGVASSPTVQAASNRRPMAGSRLVQVRRPDLTIVNTNIYGDYALAHGLVNLNLVVANKGNSASVVHSNTIIVDDVIPLGLRNIQVKGKNWHITLSDTISPAVIHAQYTGPATLEADMALPPIEITGELTDDADPILTSTAMVSILGDMESSENTVSDTLLVRSTSFSNQTSK
ncbi:hypothetical protein KDK_64240 [Dictyobacter kobayashii]|uniref:DUF11 domain-containing protein n=2 Tax=Dictyobacter kobayashii TaxID=2014872 RepID=A0A402AU53_9CHLR|nr:hypothetical protein KDK_64240 [Dictyobacter kobayashii]